MASRSSTEPTFTGGRCVKTVPRHRPVKIRKIRSFANQAVATTSAKQSLTLTSTGNARPYRDHAARHDQRSFGPVEQLSNAACRKRPAARCTAQMDARVRRHVASRPDPGAAPHRGSEQLGLAPRASAACGRAHGRSVAAHVGLDGLRGWRDWLRNIDAHGGHAERKLCDYPDRNLRQSITRCDREADGALSGARTAAGLDERHAPRLLWSVA